MNNCAMENFDNVDVFFELNEDTFCMIKELPVNLKRVWCNVGLVLGFSGLLGHFKETS